MSETVSNILLSSQLGPFCMDIRKSIPENVHLLARTLKALVNIGIFVGIFLGISMENGPSWLEKWIFQKGSGISLRVS